MAEYNNHWEKVESRRDVCFDTSDVRRVWSIHDNEDMLQQTRYLDSDPDFLTVARQRLEKNADYVQEFRQGKKPSTRVYLLFNREASLLSTVLRNPLQTRQRQAIR
jgi:hypothetical protein